jgi:hypothetical protein
MGLFFLICRKFSTYWNNLCILEERCITAEGNMKVLRGIFVSIAFVSAVFFACTNEKNDPVCTDDDCDEVSSSSSSKNNNTGNNNSSSSSSPVASSGCAYQPTWCGDISFSDILTTGQNNGTGNGPVCIFATAIAKLGNENGQGNGIRVNGIELKGNNNSNVGGRCGNTDWGQQTCAAAMASVQKRDGGYYIYAPAWYGDFSTTGGTPNCSGGGTSSSSAQGSQSSSSAAGSTPTLTCTNVPTTGTTSQQITAPTIRCNNSTVPGTSISWSGAPNWNNPAAGTYNNIRATVTSTTNACNSRQVNCTGTLVVSNPPSSNSSGGGSSSSANNSVSYPTLSQGQSGVSTGKTTRYWDACKPSCAWTGNVSGGRPVAKSCNAYGAKLNDANTGSACPNANSTNQSYTCMDQAPWAVNDNVAYGFAATTGNGYCGRCFQLQFSDNGEGGSSGTIQGKTMIVMVSNIGGDVHKDQFDIMIPGGGVGIYNALTYQLQQNGVSSPSLGDQYGGFRSPNNGGCGNNATCVQNMCNSAFSGSGLANLKRGCDWFVSWFKIANNPNILYKEVDCPADLLSRYKD